MNSLYSRKAKRTALLFLAFRRNSERDLRLFCLDQLDRLSLDDPGFASIRTLGEDEFERVSNAFCKQVRTDVTELRHSRYPALLRSVAASHRSTRAGDQTPQQTTRRR